MSDRKEPEWLDQAVKLYQQGHSINQIAAIVNSTYETTRRYLLRAGVQLRTSVEGVRLRHPRPSWVNEAAQLYEQGYSTYQIAERVNRSAVAVREQLISVGVTLRSCWVASRLRRWRDTGTEDLIFEPGAVTVALIGYALGDGHLAVDSSVRYFMKPTILRDYLCHVLSSLRLRPYSLPGYDNTWTVIVSDVRWWQFNQRFKADYNYLRENALRWPDHFTYGFLAAEGTHCIGIYNRAVHLNTGNKNLNLLALVAECLKALGYQTTLVGPNKNGCYQLNLRGSSFAKAQFAVNSPYPNKRIPSNYLLGRHLLKPEVQRIYDEALEELYTTYGRELVDQELLPAKRTKRT